MEGQPIGPGEVLVARELLEQLLVDAARIEEGAAAIVDGLKAMTAPIDTPTDTSILDAPPAPPAIAAPIDTPPAASIPEAPAAPRVWDVTDDALSNYDAEQLVALRADHRADKHDVAGCRVCAVLVKRLGSL